MRPSTTTSAAGGSFLRSTSPSSVRGGGGSGGGVGGGYTLQEGFITPSGSPERGSRGGGMGVYLGQSGGGGINTLRGISGGGGASTAKHRHSYGVGGPSLPQPPPPPSSSHLYTQQQQQRPHTHQSVYRPPASTGSGGGSATTAEIILSRLRRGVTGGGGGELNNGGGNGSSGQDGTLLRSSNSRAGSRGGVVGGGIVGTNTSALHNLRPQAVGIPTTPTSLVGGGRGGSSNSGTTPTAITANALDFFSAGESGFDVVVGNDYEVGGSSSRRGSAVGRDNGMMSRSSSHTQRARNGGYGYTNNKTSKRGSSGGKGFGDTSCPSTPANGSTPVGIGGGGVGSFRSGGVGGLNGSLISASGIINNSDTDTTEVGGVSTTTSSSQQQHQQQLVSYSNILQQDRDRHRTQMDSLWQRCERAESELKKASEELRKVRHMKKGFIEIIGLIEEEGERRMGIMLAAREEMLMMLLLYSSTGNSNSSRRRPPTAAATTGIPPPQQQQPQPILSSSSLHGYLLPPTITVKDSHLIRTLKATQERLQAIEALLVSMPIPVRELVEERQQRVVAMGAGVGGGVANSGEHSDALSSSLAACHYSSHNPTANLNYWYLQLSQLATAKYDIVPAETAAMLMQRQRDLQQHQQSQTDDNHQHSQSDPIPGARNGSVSLFGPDEGNGSGGGGGPPHHRAQTANTGGGSRAVSRGSSGRRRGAGDTSASGGVVAGGETPIRPSTRQQGLRQRPPTR